MDLIRVQLCSDRGSCRNGSTNHAHTTSLFLIELSTFTGKELFLQQKICTGKMIVDAADKQRSAAWKHVNHLPAFQTVLFQSRNREALTQRVIAHERSGRKIDHFIAKNFTAVLKTF